MSTSNENLAAAFAGESQANRKYLAFAEKADKEGYGAVAKLFRAAAAAETIHAHAHLRAMKGVGTTEENLKAAISGETFEFESMYPPMIETAIAEGHKQAERSFRFANEVEKVHADLYAKALENIEKGGNPDYHVCSVCGHTIDGTTTERCPVCGADPKAFFKVD
ncbi:MAG: rubrerythrin family protein [Proteobacteria bacterium]|nr:rubrerythrin family protein [Pseudomonadota bacterium]MBU1611069.1 rubrerythrin family protein [Pseudomonadota bacterium]